MNFIDWLKSNDACAPALEWVSKQIDTSPSALLQTCPQGEWILWVYERAGYDFETLSPVVYAAVNRAFEYAAQELDRAGVKHELRKHIITDRTTAAAAYDAAVVARAAADAAADAADYVARAAADAAADAAAYVARTAADAARAAVDAAVVARAAVDAAYAAYAARAAVDAVVSSNTEHNKCADDCRKFLPPLIIPGVTESKWIGGVDNGINAFFVDPNTGNIITLPSMLIASVEATPDE